MEYVRVNNETRQLRGYNNIDNDRRDPQPQKFRLTMTPPPSLINVETPSSIMYAAATNRLVDVSCSNSTQ